MCSIFGAVGQPDDAIIERLRKNAGDRGRDGGRMERYQLEDGRVAILGNWRATPTPEQQQGRLQPYDGLVHNGTIANDGELGAQPGEIDSEVLARVLARHSLEALVASLERVVGSFALGMVGPSTVYLACNYKPVHYWCAGDTTYFSSMERHFEGVMPFGVRPAALEPYSCIDLTTREVMRLWRKFSRRAVVIASAGLDSTVVATRLVRDGYDVMLLHFRYGCRAESREAACIPKIAARLGCDYTVLPLPYDALGGGLAATDARRRDRGPGARRRVRA